ncbi:MAG TPA: hypothetical protein VF621_13945, partial [Pyrinomonadaceae bacterium]
FTTLLDQNKKTIDELNNQLTTTSADLNQARQDALRAKSQLVEARSLIQTAKREVEAALDKYQELARKCK